MDGNGIATAVLSVSTPGVNPGDAAVGRTRAREINEYVAEVVEDHPGRYGFFATLNLTDVAGSIAEADHCFDSLGADGMILLANALRT